MFNRRKLVGLTLIETMLSLTISLLIISFLIELYFTTQQSSLTQERFKQYQNSYREISLILNPEIKKAGYIGCAKLTEDFPLQSYQSFTLAPNNKLIITNNEITIRHADVSHATLNSMSSDHQNLTVSKAVKFSKDDILLISDCLHAEIFQVKEVSSNTSQWLTAYQPLHYAFDSKAEVSKYQVNTFYLAKTGRMMNGDQAYSLFIKDIKQRDNEIISNIELLKFSYQFEGVAIDSNHWHTFISLKE